MPSSREAASRLIAVSVGQPREVVWQGKPLRTGIYKSPVAGRVAVHPLGLAGDAQADLGVHGGVDKAVYAYDDSSVTYWCHALGRSAIEPGGFGENLTISGWPETQVFIGDRFRIGSALFEVSQPRQPCLKLAKRFEDPGFPKRFLASGRVGFYFRVIEPGDVGAGDPIARERHDPTSLDVASLVAIFVDREASEAALARAASLPALADAWRVPLAERRAERQAARRP